MSTYEGNAHWDEFLEFFEKEPEIIDTFLAEMDNCQQDADQIIDDYIQMMIKDAPILVDFLMLLGQAGRRRKDFNMVNRFINATVTQLMSNKQARENFANLFYYYTIDIHKFIKSLNFRNVIKFMDIFSVFGQDEQLYFAITKKLTSLLNIYNVSSNYIKRYFANVLDNYPRFTAYADDFQEMNRITKMILQESYQIKDTKLCEQKLRDYFNIELCRLSLMMLNLEDHQQICREFRQMVDRFIREMYLNTWHQLSREMPESFGNLKPFNGIGIFASGGNAREEAFDNDYDMFVLVMPEVYQSQSNLAHFAFNKLTARLASALSRSGISPHNRFIEHCGSYIITIEEMEKFFQQTGPTDFIDKTEILNSRLVIGDARLEGQLYKKIISPFIFKDYSNFIFCLQNEMKSRHQHCKESDAGLDLKEDIGGLRDIHLFLSILKAFFGIRTPITWKVFQMLRNKMPTHFRQLKDIEKSLFFIKKVRDIYRLTVANDDLIDQDYLEKTAVFMGYSGRPSKKGDMLLNDLTRAKGRAIRNINNILDYYQAQLDKKG